MEELIRPVQIAGGGLAGLSLGIALVRRGASVTLHEAGAYPRHRVCGEFISGVTHETLEKLGIVEHFRDATKLSTSRWFDGRGEVANIPVAGMGISRWKLDESLRLDFIRSGGNLRIGSRSSPDHDAVWAAGRMRTDGDWIGVKCHVHEMSLEADLEMHIGRNGYVGLARVENQIVNVCGLFRKQKGVGGKDALFQCLRIGGLIRLADRISRARPDPNSFCAVAGFQTGRQAGPPFSIGDASQMIPPFTGNGMSMAFESAECALDPLLAFASGKISWKAAAESSSDAQSRRFSRRMRAAGHLHSLILTRPGLVSIFARNRLIPSRLLLRILRW